jgi:catechol O-methyltransferase
MAADNVIKPGNPPYLEYVRSTVEEKKHVIAIGRSADGVDARFEDRTSKQFVKREGVSKLDDGRVGNPMLVYESQLINSFEPTGVPVYIPAASML